MPSGVCDGVDGVTRKVREMIRAGADVIKIASSGGFLSATDDPDRAELLPGGGRRDRSNGGRPGHARDVARARSRGHQARGPGRRALDRPRHVPGREGVELMLERGTWLVPTLTAGDTTEEIANNPHAARARAREDARARPPRARRVPHGGRGGGEGRDGHRLPGGAARHEPSRARSCMAENGFTPEQALWRPRRARPS